MVIHIHDDVERTARAVADVIATAVQQRPTLVLGLPTGRTPVPVYAELRRRYAERTIDFSRATSFNLDEFAGGNESQRGPFRRVMEEHLFREVNFSVARIGFLDGAASDVTAECHRYEEAIRTAGGIDLQLLGIGTNGHIGFNEPGDHVIAQTHYTTLLPPTREANAALFGGDPSRVPAGALTMGVGTILSARHIVLMAFGERKARCIEQLVHGPVTTRLPASFLQLHQRVDLFLDRSAASRLTER